jgi:hypothetical protein
MKWSELKKVVSGKLNGTLENGTKRDQGWVPRLDGTWIGYVKIGHHDGQMKPYEVGNCARSLFVNEHNFKLLVACPLSREQYCEIADAKAAVLIRQ